MRRNMKQPWAIFAPISKQEPPVVGSKFLARGYLGVIKGNNIGPILAQLSGCYAILSGMWRLGAVAYAGC